MLDKRIMVIRDDVRVRDFMEPSHTEVVIFVGVFLVRRYKNITEASRWRLSRLASSPTRFTVGVSFNVFGTNIHIMRKAV